MSLTSIGSYRVRGPQKRLLSHPVAAATKIFRNQHLALVAGYALPWPSSGLGLISGGVARDSIDNSAGLDGALRVEAEAVVFLFKNGTGADAFAATDTGALAYGGDEETACKTNNGGTRSPIGRVVEVILSTDARCTLGEEPGVYVDVGDVSNGVHRAPIVIEKTVVFGDLTAAATTMAINIGGVLPTGARLRAAVYPALATAFSGGALSAMTMQLGYAADPDAVTAAFSVFTGATGFPKTGTAGVLGFAGADLAGKQLQLLFTATDANVNAATAGSVSARVELYIE